MIADSRLWLGASPLVAISACCVELFPIVITEEKRAALEKIERRIRERAGNAKRNE